MWIFFVWQVPKFGGVVVAAEVWVFTVDFVMIDITLVKCRTERRKRGKEMRVYRKGVLKDSGGTWRA